MRIAFITGSLEFGRNGVSDYTKSLINELRGVGHSCCCIALNDLWVDKDQSGICEVEGTMLCRLSNKITWDARIRRSHEFLNDFQPDFISLQFVGYAYHPRAFVYGLAVRIKSLLKGRKLHLMLHELWIGESTEYGLKDRLIGHFQKHSTLKMIRELHPDLIHTSNIIYQLLLQRNGIHAGILPLFGNIPILKNPDTYFLFKMLNESGLKIDTNKRKDFMLFGIFGTIHPQWNPEKLLSQLVNCSEDLKKTVVFISIGRIGAQGEKLWEMIGDSYSPKIRFIKLGEQSESRISHFLQLLDIGIATTPWALIEKSGSVAAMLDHGLPVLVTRNDWDLRQGKTPDPLRHPLLHRFDDNFITSMKVGILRAEPKSLLPDIAEKFINSLDGIHNNSMSLHR